VSHIRHYVEEKCARAHALGRIRGYVDGPHVLLSCPDGSSRHVIQFDCETQRMRKLTSWDWPGRCVAKVCCGDHPTFDLPTSPDLLVENLKELSPA
jgi:hypothetical protein